MALCAGPCAAAGPPPKPTVQLGQHSRQGSGESHPADRRGAGGGRLQKGYSGTLVSNSCTATQTDVASSSGSRQQRHPPRPSDSAATNDSTQGTCAHTLSMQHMWGVRGRVEPLLDRGMLNCQ